jgi:hypothetical protein
MKRVPRSPATLFARPRAARAKVPYPTRRAALRAVAAGKKAVMMDSLDGLATLVRDARALGLAVVVHGDHAYALRLADTWRIAALDALRASTATWSDAAEAQQSRLLGYTEAQIAAWLAQYREVQAAWGTATIYALLDATQLHAARARGMRAFGEGAAIFCYPGRVIRRAPAGTTIVRAGLDWDVADRVFRGTGFATAVVTPAINGALRSNLQVWTPRGWK